MHFILMIKWKYIIKIGASFTIWKPISHYVIPNNDIVKLPIKKNPSPCMGSRYKLIMSGRYKCVDLNVVISGGKKIENSLYKCTVKANINVADRMRPSPLKLLSLMTEDGLIYKGGWVD